MGNASWSAHAGASLTVALVALACIPRAHAQDALGLVAHYTFDEGEGSVARDVSGNGNDGRILGATYATHGNGSCLEFDGIDDYVDCGGAPSLDLRGTVTIEAWVYPERRVTGEPGILGKHFESYLLSYYADGKCWWYVSGGGNNAKGLLTADSWHHLAGVFDGTSMTLYIDGSAADSHSSKASQIKPGQHFLIGAVLGDASATDPAYVRTAYFPGKIDEVRVYNRALAADEVRAQFERGVKDLQLAAEYAPGDAQAEIAGAAMHVRATANGQLQIDTGNAVYLVETTFSYPGEHAGRNRFAAAIDQCEPEWQPKLEAVGPSALRLLARGSRYEVERAVDISQADRINICDTVTNLGEEPVGVIIKNSLTALSPFDKAFTPGGAENPSIFLAAKTGALGILATDDVSRIRFEPSLGLPANQARFTVSNIAVTASERFSWRLYMLNRNADYFDFVNVIREDLQTNFTIEGPFAFFDVGSPILHDAGKLKAYLERRKLGIAALSPWLDYDPGTFDCVWTRDEYKARMQEAAHLIKQADPNVKCIGCIETDWVTIFPDKLPGGDKLPRHGTGSGLLDAEQTRIVEQSGLPWLDSVKRRPDGNFELELYARGGKPQTALSVYPRIGNYQYRFLMDQVKFLLDEVGLDGFYIDEFNQGWRGGIPSYEGWDGISVEIDSRTGRISRKFVDCSLAGRGARVNLCRYALDRGKIVVANTYATAYAEQSLPVYRFSETQGSFDPMAIPDGAEPPGIADIFRGNLATPIGLGIVGVPEKHDTAHRIMKAVIAYLRHGALYYHYAIEDIPESGDGSGEYGPINHLYPITPTGLHKGWIEGKERTITAISGDFFRSGPNPPLAHRFDLNGREILANFEITQEDGGYKVQVRIKDWAEIVVIE